MQEALERALAREVSARFATARQFREAFADGPTATAPELASYLQQVCSKELASLDVPDDAPATRSVVLSVTPTQLTLPAVEARAPAGEVMQVASADVLEPVAAPPKRGRQVVAVAAVMVAAGVLVAGGVRFLARAPLDAVASSAGPHVDVTNATSAEVTLPTRAADAPTQTAEDAPTQTAADAPTKTADVPTKTAEDAPTQTAGDVPTKTVDVSTKTTADSTKTENVAAKTADVPTTTDAPPTSTSHGTRRTPTKSLRVGFLSADAVPWAEVRLGGKVLDRTPFARYPLPVGKHTLTFRGPDGAEQKRVVSVTEGDVTAVRVEFSAH